jgi:hypothetical protein
VTSLDSVSRAIVPLLVSRINRQVIKLAEVLLNKAMRGFSDRSQLAGLAIADWSVS